MHLDVRYIRLKCLNICTGFQNTKNLKPNNRSDLFSIKRFEL